MIELLISNENYAALTRAETVRYSTRYVMLFVTATNKSMAKAIAASLRDPARSKKVTFRARELNAGPWAGSPDGYRITTTQLPKFATTLIVGVAKTSGLITGDRRTAIAAHLEGPEFDTPMLPAWMERIAHQLELRGALKGCGGVGIEATLVDATSKLLDEIVTQGLQSRAIKIQ